MSTGLDSARWAGAVVGAAAGLATLEFPTVGWSVVIAFVAGAVIARRGAAAGGAMLAVMGLEWVTLLLANGTWPEVASWIATGALMLASGGALLLVDRWRREPTDAEPLDRATDRRR